jgi:ADP-ribose pyrophosphatase
MEEINPWTITDSRKVYENNWIGLTEHNVINPSGGKGIYGQVHFKNHAIGILPLDDEMNTWIVGQYRFPLNAYSWEIPEGGGDLNQPILDGARRELLEETGIIADEWIPLLTMHLSNSVSDEKATIFIARKLTIGLAEPEETEELVLRKLPFEEAYQMVMNGEITDSMSVAALLKAKILILEGKL